MESYIRTHDAGSHLEPHFGIAHTTLTAAGAGDNTEVLGPVIDRMGQGAEVGAYSAVAVLKATAVLAATFALNVTSKLRHGDNSDGSTGWEDYVPPPLDGNLGYAEDTGIYSESIADAAVGVDAQAEANVFRHVFPLSGAKRYIRHAVTPDLTRSGTDTATVASVVLLGGKRGAPDA